MLAVVEVNGERARAGVLPAPRAVVSWTTTAETGALDLVVHTIDGRASRPLPYAAFEPGTRASLDGFDDVARIATDVVSATSDIVAIEVHANVPLAHVAVTVPVHQAAAPVAPFAGELAVPELAQVDPAVPASSGWCVPASIAMLLGAHGVERRVDAVAHATYDRAYRGTGNWAFAMAYAARCGCFGAVAYLRGLAAVDALLAAGLPPALSISWGAGDLPGAPLPSSDGHLVVVRGRTPDGDVIANDPAQPHVRHVYPAGAFARAWRGHGGVALLVAPAARIDDLVRGANA